MIRFAEENDISEIMKFIDECWRKNHILSRDRVLFDFQHKWEDEISFVISENNKQLTGVLGYIPYSDKNRDVTLAIWKTQKTEDTMQGINILNFLRENGDVKSVSAPGINPKTIPIYKFLGIHTGKMIQWYRLREVEKYTIANVTNGEISQHITRKDASIIDINDYHEAESIFGIEDCLVREHQLAKSKEFIKRRYFEHPSFTYLMYGVKFGEQKLFIVLRVQKYGGSALLRVIDCVGDHELFRFFTDKLDSLLKEYECEYADCFETGVSDKVFEEGGWLKVTDSGNIMPDYFAPFEQRNVDIYYMSEVDGVVLFKGDGDMDRPN